MPAKRDAQGHWLPGVSGNRKGAAKITTVGLGFSEAIRKVVGEHGEKLIAVAWACALDDTAPWGARMEAVRFLSERGFGRPTEVVDSPDEEMNGVGVPGHRLREYSDTELKQMIAEAQRREMPANA